jgi:hypothetical protein
MNRKIAQSTVGDDFEFGEFDPAMPKAGFAE